MNFPFNGTFTLLLVFWCCRSYEQESTLKRLIRQKRQFLIPSYADIKKTCTVFYDNFFEREETINRGYFMSKLTIVGSTIRISDIPAANFCKNRIIAIELFATEKIIFDKDYDSQGQEVTLVAAAPTWIVIGDNRKVILTGKSGKEQKKKKKEARGSLNGIDGKEGKAGGPGGHFYGAALNFQRQSNDGKILNENKHYFPLCYTMTYNYLLYEICNTTNFAIKFYTNGGDGGKGQDGGNGRQGRDGSQFNFDTRFMESNGYVPGYDIILQRSVEPSKNETYLGNGISEIILGERPTSGGRGGNSGPGGLGGKQGGVVLLSLTETVCVLERESPITLHRGRRGKDGENGQPGLGGLPGRPGADVRLNLYSSPNKTIEVRNVQYYSHELLDLTRALKNGTISDRKTDLKFYAQIYNYATAIHNYKAFLFDNLPNAPNISLHRLVLLHFDDCHLGSCVGC